MDTVVQHRRGRHDRQPLRGLWRPVQDTLGRDRPPVFPWVALTLAGSVVATALVTNAFVHEIPARLGHELGTGWPSLRDGAWWTLGTSFVLTRDWFMAATMPICLFASVSLYERRAGHVRALAVTFIGHVTATVIAVLVLAPLVVTGVAPLVRAANNIDYGASMAIAASLGALVGVVGDRRLTILAFVILAVGIAAHHQMSDWGHAVALPGGYLVGRARDARVATRMVVSAVAATVGIVVVVGGVLR